MWELLLRLVATFSLIPALVVVVRSGRWLWETTLVTASRWAAVGLCLWLVTLVVAQWANALTEGVSDLLWYFTAVVCACPSIAVLGARRPGAKSWAFFVLLPLLLVLMWPAVAASRVWSNGVPLDLEEPALVAFAVVLVMGCGNYFGTRFTLPVLLYAGAIVSLLAPLSAASPASLQNADVMRSVATLLMSASIGVAYARSTYDPEHSEPLNRLWLNYIDHFGMAWPKRVMDRVNESARHEKWAGHLDWHGIVWQPNSSEEDRARTRQRMEEILRWLLKRFVEPEWINRRLGTPPTGTPQP